METPRNPVYWLPAVDSNKSKTRAANLDQVRQCFEINANISELIG